jgi:hypothetical protein
MAPGSRVLGVDPLPSEPGTVLVAMNRRPLYFDLFRIDVASGATRLHLEQDDPTRVVLLDRDGAPAFHTAHHLPLRLRGQHLHQHPVRGGRRGRPGHQPRATTPARRPAAAAGRPARTGDR